MSSSEDDQPGPSTPPRVEDDNAALPALFWDTMPEQYEEQPDYVALKALEEESTPEERAENFKVIARNLKYADAACQYGLWHEIHFSLHTIPTVCGHYPIGILRQICEVCWFCGLHPQYAMPVLNSSTTHQQ